MLLSGLHLVGCVCRLWFFLNWIEGLMFASGTLVDVEYGTILRGRPSIRKYHPTVEKMLFLAS